MLGIILITCFKQSSYLFINSKLELVLTVPFFDNETLVRDYLNLKTSINTWYRYEVISPLNNDAQVILFLKFLIFWW
jgi:hypothetical protein